MIYLRITPKLSSGEWSIIFEDRELELNIIPNFFMGPEIGYQLCDDSHLTILVVSSSYPLP